MHSELKVPQLNLLNKFHGRNLVIMLLMTWRSNILCHSASNFGSVWGTFIAGNPKWPQCNFVEITLWYGCSPVNLLHILRTPFYKNISKGLLPSFKHLDSRSVKKKIDFMGFNRDLTYGVEKVRLL